MSHLSDPFFIFIFRFTMINCIMSWIQAHLFPCSFSRICPILVYNVDKKWILNKWQKFSLRMLLSICLIFCQFQPGAAYKSVACNVFPLPHNLTWLRDQNVMQHFGLRTLILCYYLIMFGGHGWWKWRHNVLICNVSSRDDMIEGSFIENLHPVMLLHQRL